MKVIKEVMVIDDDSTLVFLAEKFIELTDMVQTVTSFNDGHAAFNTLIERDKAKQALPDIILLDITMQDWDAWRTLDELKTVGLFDKLCIYIVTSSASREDREHAKFYHLEDFYLEKPISPEVLKSIFESHLGK